MEEFLKKLIDMGYKREEEVSGKGQFAMRGGILDIFSPQEENPVRIEFFDIQADSIREFDTETQRSVETLKETTIIPASEFSGFDFDNFLKKLREKVAKLRRKKVPDKELIENLENDIDSIENGIIPKSIYKYAGLMFDKIPTILDYFDGEDIVFLAEPKRIAERAKSLEWDLAEEIKELASKSIISGDFGSPWAKYADLAKEIQQKCLVSINTLMHTSINYTYKAIFNFITKTTVSLHGRIDYLYDDLKKSEGTDKTTVILAGSASRAENLAGTLCQKGIKCRFEREKADFKKGETLILKGRLEKGFEYPDLNFTLISPDSLLLHLKSNLIFSPLINISIFSSKNCLFISFTSKYNFLSSSSQSLISKL